MNPWYFRAIIYEVYVDKFAVNFRGLIAKLDYFNYLGINTLWLLPHYPSPMVDGGYDVSDYTSVRPALGDMHDFDEFLERAHQKGIRVMTDLVLNHTSSEHPWFVSARSSKVAPKRDWYLWSDHPDRFSDAFVHFENIKNSNWIQNPQTNDYYYASFYPEQPDLNWDNPEVYEAMLEVMKFWLGRGVDGFRLDAISRLVKRDNTNCFALPETHQIIKRFRADIGREYPDAIFLAESGGWPNEAKTFFGEGDECQMVLNFPLASNLLAGAYTKDLTGAQRVWEESGGIPEDARWGVFLTNHDSVDLFFLDEEARKKLAPDNVGFSARLAEIYKGDVEKILWAFKEQFRFPGVPIVYYGNEIGMTNARLNGKPSDERENVRGDFDWDMAKQQMDDPNSLLNKIRNIISGKD